ncbi:HAMP domain-containing sensor histidine kinase [Bacillus sp. 165]|uniref:sensor histidine kinase n=1 Tax=Bacillus sp. 165 TaxID=1529117 RepID=UPI001ADA3FA9|nr:HAMP domain-containing sensor histidine kinase [Bacillus sp. 165]MBO9130852.1 HAMP domain-containing histidine kinase [Bacillus sp. 165]
MFQRTRIRLTILNSLVFIVLIGILATVIYSYAQSRLDYDVNKDLYEAVQRIQQDKGGLPRGPRDPRIVVLIWNKNDEMLTVNEDSSVFTDNPEAFRPKDLNKLQDIQAEGFYFRAISMKGYKTTSVRGYIESEEITIQLVRNITSEQSMLQTLLLILIVGSSVGSVCAVGIGFFLAGRALIPIKEAWQKQQEFVSDASHELRTPLAVIQAKTDLLWRAPTATIQDKAVDISAISKECRRLSKLVSSLLTLARSDSNQLEMEKEEFSLSNLLQEMEEHYSEIAVYQEKILELDVASSVSFMGDKERIYQLLVILLDNALKYTQEGGRIVVSCFQTLHTVVIKVQDNGIGIEEEHISKVFDRFYQVDKSRMAESGAGLGLAIAKWIIDKHHGKVKIDSKLGKGTCFEITFPKNQK